jgi:hypothetical protein
LIPEPKTISPLAKMAFRQRPFLAEIEKEAGPDWSGWVVHSAALLFQNDFD